MKTFQLVNVSNDSVVAETLATTKKEAKEFWSDYISFYSVDFKIVEVGVSVNNRTIYYKDLVLNTAKELKTISETMIKALLSKDFSNDNQTFFMLERGLVNKERTMLSDKGKELVRVWCK